MIEPNDIPAKSTRIRRIVAAVLYLSVLGGGTLLAHIFTSDAVLNAASPTDPVIFLVLFALIVLTSLPFVPGIELGLGLLLVFGGPMALWVWLGLVSALMLSYGVGRFMPIRLMASFFGYVGLYRAQTLVNALSERPRAERLDFLLQSAPNQFVPFLLRKRYIALVVILNLPGNAVIGGGGGIGLVAGMSGLYSVGGYFIAVLIAAAPLPLFFWLL